jgi:hypothetical protein
VCHAFWQGHGVVDPAFRNPDVAGIAYNARLFVAGALPYVNSAEIKPPGAFLLFAPLLALGGMRMVWAAAVLWGTSLSLATGTVAGAVWGKRAGPRAAVLHAACAVIASDGDINYSFWMATPFVVAAACSAAAALAPGARRAALLWFGSGLASMLAVAIKPSAWPVCLVFAGLLARDLGKKRFERVAQATAAGIAGAAVTATLIALPFVLAGEASGLRRGLGDVSTFGNEYVAIVAQALGGRYRAIAAGVPCLFEQMPGLIALAAFGASTLFPRREPKPPLALAAWLFVLAAFLGVSYTLRFFSHDNVELWPALAVIAVRPAGVVALVLDRVERVRFAVLPVTLALGLVAAAPGLEQRWGYVHYMAERDHEVEDVCREVAPYLPPHQPVLAWGWNAWSVYEHCARRAPGRIFKVVASVTTINTNTCNNGFGPMTLRPDPARRFFTEISENPPSLFLWSSYFKEMGGDPLEDFEPLGAFLAAHYAVVDARGPFVALLRNDLVPASPRVVTQGEPPGVSSGNGTYGSPARAGSVWTSTSRTPENPALMASITQCVTR